MEGRYVDEKMGGTEWTGEDFDCDKRRGGKGRGGEVREEREEAVTRNGLGMAKAKKKVDIYEAKRCICAGEMHRRNTIATCEWYVKGWRWKVSAVQGSRVRSAGREGWSKWKPGDESAPKETTK
jgi:hypothetical protein